PAPEPAPSVPATPLKVMLLVTDATGKLLDKCSFAIFKPGVTPVKGEIRREDILMLGRTNENGMFDSDAKGVSIPPGTYPIKVVREGYKTFLSTLEVRQGAKAGYAILAFRLAAE
ncbi:MAG TPA: PEGA domain-containing protein, partial [Thermoanaerobaculia bacterium]|nr:PEGA domain-containing protein [Thermoanaerobaculia bacterium]